MIQRAPWRRKKPSFSKDVPDDFSSAASNLFRRVEITVARELIKDARQKIRLAGAHWATNSFHHGVAPVSANLGFGWRRVGAC